MTKKITYLEYVIEICEQNLNRNDGVRFEEIKDWVKENLGKCIEKYLQNQLNLCIKNDILIKVNNNYTLSDNYIVKIDNIPNRKEQREKGKQTQKEASIEKALISRWSDQYYYYTRLIFIKNHMTNPKFTDTDRVEKCKIFGIKDTKTCFITNENSKGVGDHIFEINGYSKYTNGKHGTDDEWNTVPLVGRINKSYKIYKFEGYQKNIGYQELTAEELEKCTDEKREIYNKIRNWKKYVNSRDSVLFWVMTQKEKDFMIKKEKEYKDQARMDIEIIKCLYL